MAEIKRVISYVMAPPDTRFEGEVLRRVTSNLAGITVTLSEVTEGMSFEEFSKKNPGVPVDGRSAMSLQDDVMRLSDEQLEAMGLQRKEGFEQMEPAAMEEEVIENKFTYPVHEGFGTYLFSDQTRKKFTKPEGRPEADAYQAKLDEASEED